MSKELFNNLQELLRAAEKKQILPQLVQELYNFLRDRKQLSLWSQTTEAIPQDASQSIPGKYGLIGNSPPMQAVFALMEKCLPSDFPVFIYGESGTGKELVARALHQYGKRKSQPFLSQNCAALAETLLESELFGHKKGSFTGAIADRKGHFLAADHGTLFLDEIGDMPAAMQTKLLRVLQDGEVRPVGSNKAFHVDVRIVAASNKNLAQLMQQGVFRADLFYRLNVLAIELPPLRDRIEDIPFLVQHFVQKISREMKKNFEISPPAMQQLLRHKWPGNVRELENEIRRAAAMSEGVVQVKDLREGLGT